MSSWLTVARVGDLEPDSGKHVEVGEHVVGLFRWNGSYHAIRGTCPHQGGPLADGSLSPDGVVSCPWHAWEFRVDDGTSPLSPKLCVPTYAVRVEGDAIQIQI